VDKLDDQFCVASRREEKEKEAGSPGSVLSFSFRRGKGDHGGPLLLFLSPQVFLFPSQGQGTLHAAGTDSLSD